MLIMWWIYIIYIYNKGSDTERNTNNCDLYMEIFQHIRDRGIPFTVRWTPSHLNEGKQVRPNSVPDLGIEAIQRADDLAREAAKLH